MENRLYPTWEQLAEQNNPLTAGEKALIRFLDENLPKDPTWQKGQRLKDYNGWLIFAQPFLNGSRPDVVIFHPRVGAVIYEVKDWNLDLYEYDKASRQCSVRVGKDYHAVPSPVKQVEHYQNKLVGQLVPEIGEAIDRDKSNFALIRTALYFHNASTEECRNTFGGAIKKFEDFPVFGRDQLNTKDVKAIVPDIGRGSSHYWRTSWNEQMLFWLIPPFHSIEQGTLLKMKGNQMKVAEPMPGHHRVRGIAGSGKTHALAYRAAKLASQGKDVLIITFNITLWHYIRDMIARAPFNFDWKQITFTHFHGFCKDQLIACGRPWPMSPSTQDGNSTEDPEVEKFFSTTIPTAVADAVKDHKHDRYDAILIDEGQDYYYEWYALLDQHFMKERDELLVVCDKRQNVFQRDLDWLDKRVTKQGLEKFKDPYMDLTITYRLPQKVAVMANDFSEQFKMNQELKVSKFEDNPVLLHAHHIVWLNIEEESSEERIRQAYERLKRERYSASDIVILLPDHATGMKTVALFEAEGIHVNHVFADHEADRYRHKKRAFWMGDSRLKMSTIHSFKGWEVLNVVLYIPPSKALNLDKLDALIYTAITRTRENLIVLNANQRYNDFGDALPRHWNKQ